MEINKDKQINKNTVVFDEDFVVVEMDFYDKYNRDKNYKSKALVSYKSLDELIETSNQEIKDFINNHKRFNDEQQENCIEYFELNNKETFEKLLDIEDGVYFGGQKEYLILQDIDDKAGILILQTEREKDFLKNEIKMLENLIQQEKTLIKSIPNRPYVWLKNYQEELQGLKEELKRLD